jgi:dihydroorotate dehydrogenase (NAD+) catalytic subunit
MINSVGLQNPGIAALAEYELPELRKICSAPVIANISGFSVEEYVSCCMRIGGLVDIIEVNISCPNVHGGGMSFGASAQGAAGVTRAVKTALLADGLNTPLYIKLSPNVTDIVSIAQACEDSGADGLTLINTLLGMRIDIKTKKPVIANKTGGYSGRGIFPVALRMIYDCAKAVKIPIMGSGGISRTEDVIEMMMAGASAVQVGAENLRNPLCMKEIISVLPTLAEKLSIGKLVDIIGVAE